MNLPEKVFKLTLGQLLMLDPTAYVNLCLMFPHNAKSLEEIPALTLPESYIVVMVPPRQIFLLSRQPPSAMLFDRKKAEWVRVDEETKS